MTKPKRTTGTVSPSGGEYWTFTPEKLGSLRAACTAAERDGKTEFTWEGHVLLVTYARYLIEFLASKLEGGA